MTHNYGFKPDPFNTDDWVLGSKKLSGEVIQPNGQWTEFLPPEELQFKLFETQACVSFGTNNCLEVLARHKNIGTPNWSDRFTAIVSDTDPGSGNTPKNVIEAIRKIGGIDEALLPFHELSSVQEFYSPRPMTADYLYQAGKFLNEWVVNYSLVWRINPEEKTELLKQALTFSPVGVSVVAWKQRNGLYYKEKGEQDGHWVMLYGYEEGKFWKAFDSYDATHKKLEWNYDFGTAMNYYLVKKEEQDTFIMSIQKKLISLLQQLIALISPAAQPVAEPDAPQAPQKQIEPKVDILPARPESLKEMALRVCKKEKLTDIMTQRLMQTINCESAWNSKAVGKNKDGTRDCGLVQLNEKWYLKPNNMTCEDAIADPEKCVRIMARAFRVGRASDWICYSRLFSHK